MKNKAVDFIKGNLINFIVILTSFAYLFYGMVGLKYTGLTIGECLAKCGIGVIVGLMIKSGIGENGFNKGYASDIWIDNFTKYKNACNLANEYIDRVDNFYLAEEIEKKKEYRRHLMMAYQMKYDWFFDENGNYVENPEKLEKLDKKQLKTLKKCIKAKIYNLNLFSEYSTDIEQLAKREKTDKDQRKIMLGKNTTAQIVIAIIGAYFLPVWNGWNWSYLIVSTVQVSMWIFTGILQLYTNYNYITIEKTNKLSRKIELIIKFKNECEKGLYLNNPYEIEKEQ